MLRSSRLFEVAPTEVLLYEEPFQPRLSEPIQLRPSSEPTNHTAHIHSSTIKLTIAELYIYYCTKNQHYQTEHSRIYHNASLNQKTQSNVLPELNCISILTITTVKSKKLKSKWEIYRGRSRSSRSGSPGGDGGLSAWTVGISGERERRRSTVAETEIVVIFVVVVTGVLRGHDLREALSSGLGGEVLSAFDVGDAAGGGGARVVATHRRHCGGCGGGGVVGPLASVDRAIGPASPVHRSSDVTSVGEYLVELDRRGHECSMLGVFIRLRVWERFRLKRPQSLSDYV